MFAPFIRRTCSAVAVAVSALVFASTAYADHPGTVFGEAPLPEEVAALGLEHATEHAASPSTRAAREDGPSTSPANAITGGTPDEVGRWISGPEGVIDLPTFAIHAVMLPTGKVLFWGYPPRDAEGKAVENSGQAALWDPKLGTGPASVQRMDPPMIDPDGPGPQSPVPAPLYCSGQTLLPNGDVLATGGNLVWPDQYEDDNYTDAAGLNTVFSFDPFAERWVRQDDMAGGRWYPSQVLLGDGRTAILAGRTEAESPEGTTATESDVAEIFTPPSANGGQGDVEVVGRGGEFLTSMYPHLFTLPNDEVLMFGPGFFDNSRYNFDGATATRTYGPDSVDGISRYGGTAVLQPGGYRGGWNAMQLGGWDDSRPVDDSGLLLATNTSTEVDGKTLRNERGADTPVARAYADTVLLPDRSMVTVGGAAGRGDGYGNYLTNDETELKQVEVYDPKSKSWSLGPSQREYRTYHSVALLLPDGRVWSAGDDYHEVTERGGSSKFGPSTSDTAEIYEPPYLFRKGPRPKIKRVAEEIGYGDTFGVKTGKGRGRTAVLMAPGATTHAVDMHQRMVVLKKLGKVKGKGLNMKTPERPGIAPPGYYMLFVLNGNGKPSVAEWVKLSDDAAPSKRLKGGGKKRGNKRGGKGKRR